MSSSRSLLSIVVLAFVALLSQAQSTKDVAIDDTDKAWLYFPESSWGAISDKNPCTACNTQPDPEKVHGKTWHDLSKGGSAQLSFVGSGVVVYAVCPKGVYRLNVTFLVDNEPAGHFMAPEGGCKDYTYNQIIYRKSGLPVAPHIFQVNNWIAPGDEYSTSDLVIDYAVVTPGDSTEDGNSPTTSQSTTKTTTSVQPPASTPQPGSTETIDDVNASWSYNGPWGQISAASPCPACQTQPDAAKAHGTTWHDLSQAGSASLSFTGTGVKVYTICPGPLANGGAFSSRFAFFLDGKEAGTHVGEPTGCKEYVYDQLVYEISGLSSGSHNFTIQNVIAESGNTSDLILDYAVVEGSTSGSPSPSPSGTSQPTFPSLGPGPVETNTPEDAGSRMSATGIVGVLMASLVVALGL